MRAIDWTSERGGMLMSALFVVIFLGTLGAVAARLIMSESQTQIIYAEERKAFYAAQSGLEYGVKRFLTSDVTRLGNWSETVPAGGGASCQVSAQMLRNNRVRITANGRSTRFVKRLETTIDYIDVSQYAIYAAGRVQNVITKTWPRIFSSHNPALIYQNAPIMPIFDLDELRRLSRPSGYYTGNLVVGSLFFFPPRRMVFVENNLIINRWSWSGWGYFTVGRNVVMASPWLPFATIFGIVYQPSANAMFQANRSILGRSFIGGIITNGNVRGRPGSVRFPFFGRLTVFHRRQTIINFMQNSLNGGSLLIRRSMWQNLN